MLDVNSAIAVEKDVAADTMGTLFAATGENFLPYVEQCTLELIELTKHYCEGIRKSSGDSLLEIIRTFYELPEPAEWQPGPPRPRLRSTSTSRTSSAISFPSYSRCTRRRTTRPSRLLSASTVNKVGPRFLDGCKCIGDVLCGLILIAMS